MFCPASQEMSASNALGGYLIKKTCKVQINIITKDIRQDHTKTMFLFSCLYLGAVQRICIKTSVLL